MITFAPGLKTHINMKSSTKLYFLIITLLTATSLFAQKTYPPTRLNTAIDNMGYWRAAMDAGLTAPNPSRTVPSAEYTGSEIRAVSVITDDSPDVCLISGNTSQSENSAFINPNDPDKVINSNNSTNTPSWSITLYGANYLYTADQGETWEGSVQGAGGTNSGDPTTAIGRDGRYFINYINNGMGQSISYSDDGGATWASTLVANGGGNTLDKNHMWIDNCNSSPYEGNIYIAYTPFGGTNDQEVELRYSSNNGINWSNGLHISGGCNAGYMCHGVNLQTGPGGEVYAAFAIYDTWPSDETAIGFARSLDGGATWESFRAISNIKGIRSSGTGKNMRVNAFPVMACDVSNSPNRGNIYIIWPNHGVPGVNSGNDVDVYMIRSEDNGDNWSAPVRVNQDPAGMGKKHYQCWITCDPQTGTLSTIFYDDRNVSSSQCEVYCANSSDAGSTWEDFKVSDVAFTPTPITGLASSYFGDYINITANGGKVYPIWTDNRTATALTYTSPYQTSTMTAPIDLIAQVDEETGQVNLSWTHPGGATFDHYNVYRGLTLLGTCTLPFYTDMLPAYGSYTYKVTAVYTVEGESAPATATVEWGHGQAEVNPGSIEVTVLPDGTLSTVMQLANTGQLPLSYTSGFSLPQGNRGDNRSYCTGIGSCGGEGIAGVLYGDVSNFSACVGYEDYTALSTLVPAGDSFTITVQNITNIYPQDVCGIWVDWNQNEDFTDDGSITVSGSPGTGPYTATINVPDNAKNGMARMRIRVRRGGTLSACGSSTTGEVEDYSVNVLGWVTASPRWGSIQPGSSQDITFNFDAASLALGDYHANYTIHSNDPDGDIIVPVTMHVVNASVDITTNKDTICYGGSTLLNTTVVGGSGNYTYSWTSDPTGFTSDQANPVVSPQVTTTYYVTVSDGNFVLQDQITITVLAIPVINLGQDVSICAGFSAILDAGTGFSHYLWSTGQSTQSIEVSQAGDYWVEVTNSFGCSNRDTIALNVNPLPAVNLGQDGILCEGTSATISAGTGFATYLWSTGETTSYINVSEPGEYWVIVAEANGCSNADTINLVLGQKPVVSLGNDHSFCEGTSVTLDAGSGFAQYLWNNGATTQTISVNLGGDYWTEVTDGNGCSNRDTVSLTMNPLPQVPQTISGPTSVDYYVSQTSDFTCTESNFADNYEWTLDPVSAGIISGSSTTTGQVTWSAGFTGTANISVRGTNSCGAGSYSQTYPVSVYTSQGIGEKEIISGIKLYPNPNDGEFVLEFNSVKAQALKFQMTTSIGNRILDNKEDIPAGLYRKDFNMNNLPAGTYYLMILDKNGRLLNRQQIVVK
jgi:hypothetical protein